MTDNLHPADELYALRQTKNNIEARIKEVRALLIELPPEERQGASFAAQVTSQDRATLDMDAIQKEMGLEWVETHTVKTTSIFVRTAPLPGSKVAQTTK